MTRFVNRKQELERLEAWWGEPGAQLGLVWGRRRVGKTLLLQEFAKRTQDVVYHTASGRPELDELAEVSRLAHSVVKTTLRDLAQRPFSDWLDCLETLGEAARQRPLLLVLDEFPELRAATPELEKVLRAFWDRARSRTQLRILLCGSAVRTMKAIQEERAPLYGRIDLSLRLDPFDPCESAQMLPRLEPAERALVWGIVGGVPLYLEWWDQDVSPRKNLERLVCSRGGRLLIEGDYVLATEGTDGDLARQILFAVAAGRTKFNEIQQSVGTNPSRTIDNLIELRLLERVVPVTESEKRSRRRAYRIADNFLAFWLGIVSRYRAEIDRGLGKSILPVLFSELDDHMEARWEEAFRLHLRRLADSGELGPEVVAIGPYWSLGSSGVEIDAVALAGREREAVLVGEAKWARTVNGARALRNLERKAEALPKVSGEVVYAVCARDRVTAATGVRAFTAKDIFGR